MILLAIDPGKTGAVACWRSNDLLWMKCPETPPLMAACLPAVPGTPCRALLEKVHAGTFNMGERCPDCGRVHSHKPPCPSCRQRPPVIGARSQFNFGLNFGLWQGILAALNVPTLEMNSKDWQKAFASAGLPRKKKDRKKAIHTKVNQEFPGKKIPLYAADAVAMLIVLMRLENLETQMGITQKRIARVAQDHDGKFIAVDPIQKGQPVHLQPDLFNQGE